MNRILLLLTLIITAAAACTKIETTELGQDIIPVVDGVNTFEQYFAVNTKDSLSRDSIFPINSDNLVLGKIDASADPIFGETKADLNFEVRPGFYKYSFAGVNDGSRELDSVVLVISSRGFYGDSSVQSLSVYELNEKIARDTIHKTTRAYATTGAPLTTVTIDPKKVKDSMYMFHEQAKNQIRLKLPQSFGNRFLAYDSVEANNGAYVKDSLFVSKFKGFSVKSNNGKGLFYVSLLDTNTKLAFYYKYKATATSTTKDTTVSYFKFASFGSGFSNYIQRRATGISEAGPQLASINTQDTVLYIQTAPGTHARLRIPGLSTFPNKIIHRAELLIEELADVNAGGLQPDIVNRLTYPAPNLFVSATAPDSTRKFLVPFVDVTSSGISFSSFGGFPIKKTINGQQVNTYNINITRYVQGIVTRQEKNLDLYLYAPFNESVSFSETVSTPLAINSSAFNQLASGRVRLGGGTHTKQALRLRIVYSNL